MNKNEASNNKAKNNTTKIICVVIAVVLVLIIIIGIIKKENTSSEVASTNINSSNNNSYVEEIENGVKLNTNSKLNEAKEVDGYKISNIQLTTKDGITTLLADVTNTSGSNTELKTVEVTLLDEEGNELTTVKGVISELEANGTTKLNIATTSDYINAYDFKVKVN